MLLPGFSHVKHEKTQNFAHAHLDGCVHSLQTVLLHGAVPRPPSPSAHRVGGSGPGPWGQDQSLQPRAAPQAPHTGDARKAGGTEAAPSEGTRGMKQKRGPEGQLWAGTEAQVHGPALEVTRDCRVPGWEPV